MGFGRHPGDRHATMDPTASFQEESPMLGAYMVPKSCEYCGASDTAYCCPKTCRRPKMFFHKKRPPFAAPDPDVWDPQTDEAVRSIFAKKESVNDNQNQKVFERQASSTDSQNKQQLEEEEAKVNRKYWVRSLFGVTPPTA